MKTKTRHPHGPGGQSHPWRIQGAGLLLDKLDREKEAKRFVTLRAWGSNNGAAKLTEFQVRIIRKAKSFGVKRKELGLIFNVCQSTISAIINHKTWRCVP